MSEESATNLERTLNIIPEAEATDENLPVAVDENGNLPVPVEEDEGLPLEVSIADVYERAISAFEEQVNNAAIVEPRYAARNMEVAKGFLDTALQAVQTKQKKVEHTDKMDVLNKKQGGAKNITNNVLVADRNDVLKHIMGGGAVEDAPKLDENVEESGDDIIEGDVTE